MDTVFPVILGIFLIILGYFNMQGNIGSIHRYHRHRVQPEDILPFGRLMGMGTAIVGAGLILFAVLEYLLLPVIAAVLLCIAAAAGLGISFYAMIRYNKGIF